MTFERKADAERWLAEVELDIVRGDWVNPDAGLVQLGDYARSWVTERTNLRPKTAQLYEGLVRLHITPTLGELSIADISPGRVRTWYAGLTTKGVGSTTVAKAYRLLRTIMQTAVDDRLIRLNPCRIKGAATERSPERATLTVDQVVALANGMPDRYRALILLGTFASMRFGELAALRRQDLDVARGLVHIRQAVVELGNGQLVVGPPKTAAGRRVVAVPSELLDDLEWHMAEFVGGAPDALIFAGPKGGPLRRSNFQKSWVQGLAAANLTDVHFHDLRHTGNTLAAQAGATLSDLMTRMGHASTRAAQIYLHTNSERDRVIAQALDPIVKAALSGTDVARGLLLVTGDKAGNDRSPGFRGVRGGAGDGNRTRTVSLGS